MNPVDVSPRRRFLLAALSGAGALVLAGCDKLANYRLVFRRRSTRRIASPGSGNVS